MRTRGRPVTDTQGSQAGVGRRRGCAPAQAGRPTAACAPAQAGRPTAACAPAQAGRPTASAARSPHPSKADHGTCARRRPAHSRRLAHVSHLAAPLRPAARRGRKPAGSRPFTSRRPDSSASGGNAWKKYGPAPRAAGRPRHLPATPVPEPSHSDASRLTTVHTADPGQPTHRPRMSTPRGPHCAKAAKRGRKPAGLATIHVPASRQLPRPAEKHVDKNDPAPPSRGSTHRQAQDPRHTAQDPRHKPGTPAAGPPPAQDPRRPRTPPAQDAAGDPAGPGPHRAGPGPPPAQDPRPAPGRPSARGPPAGPGTLRLGTPQAQDPREARNPPQARRPGSIGPRPGATTLRGDRDHPG